MKKLDIKIEYKKTFVGACIAWFLFFIYLGVIEAQSFRASYLMFIASTIAVSALDVRNDIRTNLVFALFAVDLFLPCLSTGIVYMINGQEGMSIIITGFIAAMVIAIPQLAFCLYNKKKGLNIDGIPFEYQDHPEDAFKHPEGIYYKSAQICDLLLEYNPATSFCFTITEKLKSKAKRRRVRHERKWLIPRIMRFFSLPIGIALFIIGIYFVPYENYELSNKFGWGFAISLVPFILGVGIIANIASHWIFTRQNECIWLNKEKGTLNHFLQPTLGGGLNYNSVDETGVLYVMLIDSIHDAKYDPKSGRIEFKTYGRQYHFCDFRKNLVDNEIPLDDEFTAVFYEYTDPSLVEVLEAEGVKFTRCRLNKFSIFGNY